MKNMATKIRLSIKDDLFNGCCEYLKMIIGVKKLLLNNNF